MVRRREYNIDIFQLSLGSHAYEFEYDDTFFGLFEESLVEKGSGEINLNLLKSDSYIELNFEILGKVELICDRSLDPFWFNFHINNKLLLKFGDNWEEISDEILMMPRDEQVVNIAQYIYEFIGITIPMKKLHPRFEEEENSKDEFIYYSSESKEKEETPADPRWKKLKDIK